MEVAHECHNEETKKMEEMSMRCRKMKRLRLR